MSVERKLRKTRSVLRRAGWRVQGGIEWVGDGGSQETWTGPKNDYGTHQVVLTVNRESGMVEAEVAQWTYEGLRLRLAYSPGQLGLFLYGIAMEDLGGVLEREITPLLQRLGRAFRPVVASAIALLVIIAALIVWVWS